MKLLGSIRAVVICCAFLCLAQDESAPCKGWCSKNKQSWETKCKWEKACAGCPDCLVKPLSLRYALPCHTHKGNGTFRIALFDDTATLGNGNTSSIQQAFLQFAAEEIQDKSCFTVGSRKLDVEVIVYLNHADPTLAEKHVEYAFVGVDAAESEIGNIDIIVTGSWRPWVLNVVEAAERFSIPNVHTYAGNPSWWTNSRRFAFALALPYTEYFFPAIRAGAVKNLKTIVIIRAFKSSMGSAEFVQANAWSSLTQASELGYRVIGPSAAWCKRHNNVTRARCRVAGDRCTCGSANEVKGVGFESAVLQDNRSSFYDIDLSEVFPSDFSMERVHERLQDILLDVIADIRAQGADPDVICSAIVYPIISTWLSALWRAAMSPQMLVFFEVSVAKAYAYNVTSRSWDIQVLNDTHTYSHLHAAQWHHTIQAYDPVFGTAANAVQLFEAKFSRKIIILDAANAAVGSILKIALSKGVASWSASHEARRIAIRDSIGDLYDETLFGVVKFNRNNQTIGRESLIWQRHLSLDSNGEQTVLETVVLPERYAQMTAQPFLTWSSRFGCPSGSRNTGIRCNACPLGTHNPLQTQGINITWCLTCAIGMQPTVDRTNCIPCPAGTFRDSGSVEHYHDSPAELGRCRPCYLGTYRSSQNDNGASCEICAQGTYVNKTGSTACMGCAVGRYRRYMDQADSCTACIEGRYQTQVGGTSCLECPEGGSCPLNNVSGLYETVYPKEDWFQLSSDESGLMIFKRCPTPGACLGGSGALCADGMKGPFCNTCELGWTRYTHLFRCTRCPSKPLNILTVSLTILAFLVYIAILTEIWSRALGRGTVQVRTMVIKIFINYVQMSSVVFRVMSDALTDSLLDLFTVFAYGGAWTGDPTRIFMSLDCPGFGLNHSYEFRLSVLALVLIPVTVAVGILASMLHWFLFGAKESTIGQQLRNKVVPMTIIISFILHPIVTDMFTKAIECCKLDTWRMRWNSEMVCSGRYYDSTATAAGIGLSIWSFGLPIVLLLTLFLNRRRLFIPRIRKALGFLYVGLDHRFYYFECVFMFRKVVLLIAITIRFQNDSINDFLLLIIGIASLGLHCRAMPFDNWQYMLLNGLELRSILAFLVTVLANLVLNMSQANELRIVVPIIVLLAHANVLYLLGWSFLRAYVVSLSRRHAVKKPIEGGSASTSAPHKARRKLCSIGDLFVTRDGAVDLRALCRSERVYLEAALADLIACIVDTSQVFRTEQLNQVILVASAKAATKRAEKLGLQLSAETSTPGAGQIEKGLMESLQDARGLIARIIENKLKAKRGHQVVDVQLLSMAAEDAHNVCRTSHPRISVEEFHDALTCIKEQILAGTLILDRGSNLLTWSNARSLHTVATDTDHPTSSSYAASSYCVLSEATNPLVAGLSASVAGVSHSPGRRVALPELRETVREKEALETGSLESATFHCRSVAGSSMSKASEVNVIHHVKAVLRQLVQAGVSTKDINESLVALLASKQEQSKIDTEPKLVIL